MKSTLIAKLKPNPNNPRVIKDRRFEKLVKSLKDFPEMAKVRPIVVNKDMVVLGGNMRLRAMTEAGWKEAPVEVVDWSQEKQNEFVIKDNVNFGEWEWDDLANTWDATELTSWGLEVWTGEDDMFNVTEDEEQGSGSSPKASDDGYSVFEMVMLHENKLKLVEALNQIKKNFLFEKLEDSLMEILRVYNKDK